MRVIALIIPILLLCNGGAVNAYAEPPSNGGAATANATPSSSPKKTIQIKLEKQELVINKNHSRQLQLNQFMQLSQKIPLQNFYNLQYIGTIYVGRDKQQFKVLFDTGSNWLWLPSPNCNNCVGNQKRQCSFSNETTCKLILNTSQEELNYGIGYVKGQKAIDWVALGEESIGYYFISAQESRDLDGYNADGIFGLGFYMNDIENNRYQNYIELLHQKNLIEKKVFSFYLGYSKKLYQDRLSQLLIGDLDLNLIENGHELRYFPVTDNQYWAVNMTKFELNNNFTFEKPRRALIDTGTSLLILPMEDFQFLINYLNNNGVECNAQKIPRPMCQCPQGNINTLFPNITIYLKDDNSTDQAFIIRPKDYVRQDRYQCELHMSVYNLNDESQYWILGDSFIRNYYSVFDMDNMKIGLAKAKNFEKSEVGKNMLIFLSFSLVCLTLGGITSFFLHKYVLLNQLSGQDQRII